MLNFLKWVLPATAAVALLVGVSAKSVKAADEAAAKVKVSGTVVDQDGKPVADATVNLAKPRQRGAGGGPGAGGPGGGRPEPLATTTTDKDGKFVLEADKSKVPDGDYTVTCRVQDKGTGRAQVKVANGKADPEKVELKLQQGGRGGRGGRGGGAGA